jgi:hypothetical protein
MRTQRIGLSEGDHKKHKEEHKRRKYALRLRSISIYFAPFVLLFALFVAPQISSFTPQRRYRIEPRRATRREFHSFRASQRDRMVDSDRNCGMVAEKFRRLAPPQIVS